MVIFSHLNIKPESECVKMKCLDISGKAATPTTSKSSLLGDDHGVGRVWIQFPVPSCPSSLILKHLP